VSPQRKCARRLVKKQAGHKFASTRVFSQRGVVSTPRGLRKIFAHNNGRNLGGPQRERGLKNTFFGGGKNSPCGEKKRGFWGPKKFVCPPNWQKGAVEKSGFRYPNKRLKYGILTSSAKLRGPQGGGVYQPKDPYSETLETPKFYQVSDLSPGFSFLGALGSCAKVKGKNSQGSPKKQEEVKSLPWKMYPNRVFWPFFPCPPSENEP